MAGLWGMCCCGVDTPCCNGVPKTLHMTVTAVSGTCTSTPVGTVLTFVWNESSSQWLYGSSATIRCNEFGTFAGEFTVQGFLPYPDCGLPTHNYGSLAMTEVTCSPFVYTRRITKSDSSCSGSVCDYIDWEITG